MTRLALLSGLGHALLVAASLLVYVLATRIGHQYRHPSAALAWVLGMVAFPYVTLPLFLFFGTRKYARPPRHRFASEPLSAAVPTGAPPWATRLLAGMELAPAERNGPITFQEDGVASLQALLDLIDSAEHTLELGTFLYGNDAVGRTITAALVRCVQRGVTTRLLLDAVGSFQTPRRQLHQWLRAGVRVRRFMPLLRNPLRGRTNLRNHRKVAVADGVRLWSGGRNLAVEYFTGDTGQSAWIDLSFVVHGPLAAQAQAQFRADWHTAGGRPLRFNRVPLLPDAGAPAQGALVQWVPSGPDHADDTVHALLMSGAYQAQQRIRAVTPYFVPDDALLDAWCLACRRGVQVSVLLPARSNHRLADWARERALRQLVAAGVQVWLAPGMLHAKAVVMDEELALCGSLNLDGRSLFLNYESMAAFYGATEVQWLSDWFDRQMAQAVPYHARRPSWLRDIFEGVVRAVAFQL
ncbi:phospholipase D-like domain-containing protein [Simplicispira psychrophila]|uniref:phospholipase D-like domain-containing protein n=1 Tax=Simplicispira psychrophila TaxID=80882 RepID=UPI0004884B0B|nr:phospholipase D-like domain-containing protein [Simplicispira psychrophila]